MPVFGEDNSKPEIKSRRQEICIEVLNRGNPLGGGVLAK